VSFAAITLCIASERVFMVVSLYLVMTQSGNFSIHALFGTNLYAFGVYVRTIAHFSLPYWLEL
jgi:hypothetical protein